MYHKFMKNDLSVIGDAYIRDYGLVSHHLNSYNNAIKKGLPQIIEDVFNIDWTPNIKKGKSGIEKANVIVNFTNLNINKPVYKNNNSDKDRILTPIMAIQQNKTYSGKIYIDIYIKITGYDENNKDISIKKYSKLNCEIGEFPIMVKSDLCHLSGGNKIMLDFMEEDHSDYGGYFIIDGVEWVIETVESILFNQPRIYNNIGHKKEVTRCEFISKPGDGYQNSNQIIIRLLNNNNLTIEFNREGFRNIYFPFFVIFRLLGVTVDKEIFEKILFTVDPIPKQKMTHLLQLAFYSEYEYLNSLKISYDSIDIIKQIGIELNSTTFNNAFNPENIDSFKSIRMKIEKLIDERLLEHVGSTPNDRLEKAVYLAFLIRRLFLVNFGIIKETDRDSYSNKRLFTPGIMLCKAVKTLFNKAIIQKITRKINELKNKTFEQIDPSSIIANIESDDGLKKALFKSISTAAKSTIKIGQQKEVNRLTTQYLSRSNQIAFYAMMRQLSTPNIGNNKGQSERTYELRRIHSTTYGYLCPITTPVSDKVGINKQLAIYANIIGASTSKVMVDILKNDELILSNTNKLNELIVQNKISEHELSYVFVNGQIVGYCLDTHKLVKKYRNLRRNKKLDSIYVTIHWNEETDEVYFWCDRGRAIRPLIIVYNNDRDKEIFKNKSEKFLQKTLLTPEVLKKLKYGDIGIDYLVENKIIEFITPEEQTNYLICSDIEKLHKDKNNILHEYTHCDIPHGTIGLPGLTSPYGEHNQIARLIYQSNQVKQACGFPALNWAYRTNKAFVQYTNENPLVMTKVNNYINPNGLNVLVAIATYTGYNQEDSILFSRGFIERGAYLGSKFEPYVAMCILSKNEKFGVPNKNQTDRIYNKNYSKLNSDGIVDIGTIVKKGDVLIGKYALKDSYDEDENKYEDNSIIYKSKEDGIIHNVIVDANNTDSNIIRKVVIRKIRPIRVGDKFCVLPTQEVLTDKGWIKISKIKNTSKISSMNNNGNLIYSDIKEIFKYEVNEKLIKYNDENIKFICTSNHKIPVLNKDNNQIIFIKAGKLKNLDLNNFGFIKSPFKNYSDLNYQNISNKLMDLFKIFYYVSNYNIFKINESKKYIKYKANNKYLLELRYLFDILQINYRIRDNLIFIYENKSNKYSVSLCDIIFQRKIPKMLLDINNIIFINKLYAEINRKKCTTLTKNTFYIDLLVCLFYKINIVVDVRKLKNNIYYFNLIKSKLFLYPPIYKKSFSTISYTGPVYCLEVNNEVPIYVCRENINSPIMLTGNSSRLGQKGICARLVDDSDMPFTENGEIPAMIINPHCLTGDTLIQMNNGQYSYIKDIYDKKLTIKTMNISSLIKNDTKYYDGFKIMPKDNLIKLKTISGRIIKCTKDHKFLIFNEKHNKNIWKKAKDLRAGIDKIIIEHNIKPIFEDEINKYSLEINGQKFKDNELLLLIRLFGKFENNGELIKSKNSDDHYARYTINNKIDCNILINDIKSLGFKLIRLKHDDYNNFYEIDTDLGNIFCLLNKYNNNLPNKTIADFPEWILSAPKIIKREFISGYQDINKEFIYYDIKTNRIIFESINFIAHNNKNLCSKYYNYAKNLQKLFSEFYIRTHVKKKIYKDHNNAIIIQLCFYRDLENFNNYFDNINIKYNMMINYNYKLLIEFIKCKINGYYHSITYKLFKKLFQIENCTTIYLEYVKGINAEFVYDFTTCSDNHSFIANSFISHNCIPTRMTIGQLMESLTGINCSLKCGHVDCTIFSNKDLKSIYAELKSSNYNQFGYKKLYNGITGEIMNALIFMGPTYYQRLQKFISELVYSIVDAPTDAITMQPLDGKSSGGGLRLGEMEKDILTAQGVTRYISEKFLDHSDDYTQYICRCGKPAIVNTKLNLYRCDNCGDDADIAAIPTSWCSKLFMQELKTANIGVNRNLEPFIFEQIE